MNKEKYYLVFFSIILSTILSPISVAEEPKNTYFVVFNSPGPNWEKRVEPSVQGDLKEHAALYKRLAENGDILVSGRFEGKPVLGMTVFRQADNRTSIQAQLTEDSVVKQGIISVEFREWVILMGSLSGFNNSDAGTGEG